ncbi:MAG: bifunctional ornithine acetyltransferase/N-acetylglutamate synthase [Actinomycetota bacterium]
MSGFFRSRWVDPPEGVEELGPTALAPGFRAAGVACGIKDSGERDLGLLACDAEHVDSAALFTANAAAAAPVRVCRERADLGSLSAIAVNSGNANAATGNQGVVDAVEMQEAAAEALDLEPVRVGVASTGVIGRPLPVELLRSGLAEAAGALGGEAADFSEAIMTTDRGPKRCAMRAGGVTLSAQAKGAGMMEPGFATLLCFVQTDAEAADADARLRLAAEASFGRVTVDGQLSTNDMVVLQATGAAGRPLPEGLLEAVLLQLAIDVVADGEGATRVARVRADEAASDSEAERVARAIANSQLVQTGIFGRDPNWGRIVQAAGMALAGEDVALDGSSVDAEELGTDSAELELGIRLGRGAASAHVYCSDLTYDYVKLNAEYTT